MMMKTMMMMKALQLDQTRVSHQKGEDKIQDERHVSDLEDTDNAHIPKVSTTTWFKP
ncbi:hypothetical protein Tco_0470116, partial [Tanacetum coccineum]